MNQTMRLRRCCCPQLQCVYKNVTNEFFTVLDTKFCKNQAQSDKDVLESKYCTTVVIKEGIPFVYASCI